MTRRVYKEEENKLAAFLESLHPGFQKQLNGYYYLSFAEAQKKQWFARTYHKLLDLGIEVIGMDMLKHFRYSSHKINTEINITKSPFLNISFTGLLIFIFR